jgi:hypothetical protein
MSRSAAAFTLPPADTDADVDPLMDRAQAAHQETAALIHAAGPWLKEIARTLAVAREDHGERGQSLRWARTWTQDVRDEITRAAGDRRRLDAWAAPAPDLLARYPDPPAARRADLCLVIARPRRLKAVLGELAAHLTRFRALGPARPGPTAEDHV